MNQPKFLSKTGHTEVWFEAIAQTATDAIIIADAHSAIVFANKKAYEIFGYPLDSLHRQSLLVLMPEQHRTAHNLGMQRFINTGVNKLIGHTIEIEGMRRDRSTFPIELSIAAWQEEDAHFFSAIIRDITYRKTQEKLLHDTNQQLTAALEELRQAEEQLRSSNDALEKRVRLRTDALAASEEQLRMITNALPVLISYVNAQEVYAFVNNTYTTWFGKPQEAILGQPVSTVIGEQAYEVIRPDIHRALQGETVYVEKYMPYSSGVHRHAIIHLIPHTTEGHVAGFFALITDITPLREAQIALSKKNSELVRINTDLDNFIYTASHDLKAPIANIEGLLQMVELSLRRRLQEREHKMFAMIDVSITKLRNTIASLSDVTKVAKNLDQPIERISIPRVIDDVKLDNRQLVEAAQPVFKETYTVTEVELPLVHFRSIAYNLISNAIKYRSPQRPLVIDLQTYQEDGFVVFSVKDNGLGLLPHQLDKLFTMFKRYHTHVEGTGMGLYIVKRVVENMGGRVQVDSAPDEGTVFWVYLPQSLARCSVSA